MPREAPDASDPERAGVFTWAAPLVGGHVRSLRMRRWRQINLGTRRSMSKPRPLISIADEHDRVADEPAPVDAA